MTEFQLIEDLEDVLGTKTQKKVSGFWDLNVANEKT